MIEQFNALPDSAKIVIGVVGVLLVVLIIALLVIIISKAGGNSVRIPKQLQIGAVPIMNEREYALYERLQAIVMRHPNYMLHVKIGTKALIAPWDDLHPKIRRNIESKFIDDTHDFVFTDQGGYAVAILELDSDAKDAREEQARQAGIPLLRIDDPHLEIEDLENKLRNIFK